MTYRQAVRVTLVCSPPNLQISFILSPDPIHTMVIVLTHQRRTHVILFQGWQRDSSEHTIVYNMLAAIRA